MTTTNNALNAPLPLVLSQGGSSANLTADNGGIVYSTASALAILPHTTIANQVVLSGNNAAPSFSTATYPTTTTINQILWSSSANTIGGLATANNSVLTTNGSGVPSFTTPTQVIAWTDVTGTTQSMAVNNGYAANNAGLVTLTLPTTAAKFSIIEIVGVGAGGWLIAQNASQLIHLGNQTTTTGVSGNLASTNQYDNIKLMCVVANTTWIAFPPQGNITVV